MKPSPLHLQRAYQGYKWCTGCGENNLAPEEPRWKDRCSLCHQGDEPRVYCHDCGDPIEASALAWAERKKLSVRRCFNCRAGLTTTHPVHGVTLPSRFYSTLS